jgi:hypothetical protein
MAACPIQFSKGARPGKRPHLPGVQTNDYKRLLRNSSLSRQKQKTVFTLPQQKNKIIIFDTNKIVLKSFIV